MTSARKQSFEDSISRLETIVNDMESGELSLEDMISRFEEGQKLIKFCSKKLNEVEKKVEVLLKKGETEDLEDHPSSEEIEIEDSDSPDELF